MARAMKDSGIEWIGQIPENWKKQRLKFIYVFEKGKNAALYTQEYIGGHPGFFPVYSGQTENDGVMGYIGDYDYDIEECLFTTTVGAKVMTPKILKGKFSLSQNCLIMRGMNNPENRYIYYMLLSLFEYEKSMIPSYMQPSLRIEDLKKYIYFAPEIVNQRKIADFLDKKCAAIDSVIEKTKASIEEYKKLKQAIITQAVTKGIRGNRPTKDSGYDFIGEVPEEWIICKVRNIGSLQNGISKGSEFFGEGFPFVSYGDVYKNMTLPKDVVGKIQSTESERDLYSVKRGDIFFTRTSETIEEVGFSSVCMEDIPNATFAGFLIRLRPAGNELNSDFAKYYFRSEHHRRFLVKEMNLVTRASLGQGLLKSMPVLLPPLDEQIEIAKYLDEKCELVNSLISNKEQENKELEQYKKSLIYEYVTGKKEVLG